MTMPLRARAAALVIGISTSGCSYDSAGPAYRPTGSVSDPSGDTFGSGERRWDITGMSITRNSADVEIDLDFASDVVLPVNGDTTGVIAIIDLDTDQDSATGLPSAVDEFRTDSGSTGARPDFQVVVSHYDSAFSVPVFDSTGRPTGRVKPSVHGHRMTIHIPLALIGNDDGLMNADAIVGIPGHASDFVPNGGHLTVRANP